jgi:hypothetical protein
MDLVNCTASERILIHLLDYLKQDRQVEAPIEVTQEGIALITCIQRKHIPRSLKKLLQNDLISEKRSHVTGKRQMMKTYSLTSDGRCEAIRIKNILSDQKVPVIMNGKKITKTISEIYDFHSGIYSYSCIISQVIKHSFFNETNILRQKIKKEKNRILSPEFVYREALEEAWKDGVLTVDERNILKKLRDTLHISRESHNKIQQRILQSKKYSSSEIYRQVYDIVLNEVLKDNKISEDEQAILKKLQKYFNIET